MAGSTYFTVHLISTSNARKELKATAKKHTQHDRMFYKTFQTPMESEERVIRGRQSKMRERQQEKKAVEDP